MAPSPIMLGILLVPVLPGLPFAGDGATHTGDVDLYATGLSPGISTFCPAVIYTTRVVLELIGAREGDRVALVVAGDSPAGQPLAVASARQPVVGVDITVHGCRELVIAVVGLETADDEERAYELRYGY